MSPPEGRGSDKSIGEIVQEVAEKAVLLVRQEIALAKAEVTIKAKSLVKGVVVGVAAGVFLVFALVMLLHTLAWLINDLLGTPSIWPGFGIVTLLLIALGVVAGLLARRFLSTGPPTPDQAIEEAKITRHAFEHQGDERDQLERPRRAGTEQVP